MGVSLVAITALVNTTRVLEDLRTLRSFGATGGGHWGLGVSRRGLTPMDVSARRWVAMALALAMGECGPCSACSAATCR